LATGFERRSNAPLLLSSPSPQRPRERPHTAWTERSAVNPVAPTILRSQRSGERSICSGAWGRRAAQDPLARLHGGGAANRLTSEESSCLADQISGRDRIRRKLRTGFLACVEGGTACFNLGHLCPANPLKAKKRGRKKSS